MASFSIKNIWAKAAEAPNARVNDEVRATLARLEIWIARSSATRNKAGRTQQDSIDVPLYYLAEWIAENWWPLLYEPQKDEERVDATFMSRHSLESAQHGFPLPSLTMIPFGKSVRLNCRPRKPKYADFLYTSEAFGDAPIEEVITVLQRFLSSVDERLRNFGFSETPFQVAFNELRSITDDDEREFCELLGALGIAPAQATEDLISSLETLCEVLGPRATRDFCLAATPDRLLGASTSAETIAMQLSAAPESDLGILLKTDLPMDNLQGPSWRRGMQAAKNLRKSLGIDPADESGAIRIFDTLGIDVARKDNGNPGEKLLLGGAVDRDNSKAKIAIYHSGIEHRRFAAGRAAYLCWVSENKSRRLMTNAVTRDQQASRQFAAEILVPQEYIKKCAHDSQIGYDYLRDIAAQRRTMPDVAFKQAYNAGVKVAEI